MLVTKEWSGPKPIEYGKNILVRSSHGNFNYRIYSATGEAVQGIIHARIHIIVVDDEYFRSIRFPMISFCANTNDELHVDFEQVQENH